jgi:hypothetical protein
VLLTASPAAAQFCGGVNTDNAFMNNVSMGGPNMLWAMKYVAPHGMTVARIELFTGEAGGTSTIGLWTHDAANNAPLTNVSTGSWSMAFGNGWQGADLPSPVVLGSGTTWWVVWAPINSSQANYSPTGPLVEYKHNLNNPTGWNGPWFNRLKFRMLCAPGWPAPFTTALTVNLDGTATLDVSGAPPSATEGFTLVSATVSLPVGSPPVLGIVPDALTIQLAFLLNPLPIPGNPLHWAATPGLFPGAPFTIPAPDVVSLSGMTLDFVAVTFDPASQINGISTVHRITF